MAESMCSSMSETDIIALKETLQAQQQLLQKLYSELDEEREASASAASETLSMILRLQGEKAAVQMEANQYKRMAEEKMSHAENSLFIFEDVIYQKEMEIASLEFQVQAYRCKFLSMGCSDLGAYDCRFPETLFLQRSDLCKVETGANSNVRRLNSLPPIQLKDPHLKNNNLERQLSPIPMSDLIPKIVKKKAEQEVNVQNFDFEKKSGNSTGETFDSYWKKIKNLDERVKEISDCKVSGRDNSANLKGESIPCSLLPQVSIEKLCEPTSGESITNLEKVKLQGNIQEREAIVNYSCSSTVQDIFEVPQSNEICEAYECQCQKRERNKLILEGENRLGKPDLVSEDTFRLHFKELSVARNEASVAESQAKIQQLCHRIEWLERERNYPRQEISEVGEEELKLLKEIREQINTIQTELRSWRTKKSPPEDAQSLDILAEV
jgi:hypothetical protein